jgi:tetratricopeptide (TPR) repeat protein
MSQAIAVTPSALPSELQPFALVPWRDPYSVSPEEVALSVRRLEDLCIEHPASADLRTCLGMAYAVNYDVYKSMDALEAAIALDPLSFVAQLKYGELLYRLRVLDRSEEETLKAVELARNPMQLAIARKQLTEIRTLRRHSTRNVHWTKPLTTPALVLSLMFAVMFVVMMWKCTGSTSWGRPSCRSACC